MAKAVQSAKRVAAVPPKAVVPKPASKPAKANGGEASDTALVPIKINAKALSLDVGVAIIRDLAGTDEAMEKAQAMLANAKTKRYDLQSRLTLAIVKAASNETSINLAHAFNDDKKAQTLLNNQLGLALGFREQIMHKGKPVIQFVKEVYSYFPAPGEDRETVEYKKKQTTRTNFLHRLKQCCMAASAIISDKTKAEIDKDTGVLKLSGPAVKSQFGATSVLLNEKQTQPDAKGKDQKLTEKPSFTAIAARAAEAHGKIVNRVSNTRGAGAGGFKGKTPDEVISAGCEAMIAALNKASNLAETTLTKLRALVNACNAKLH